MELLENTLKELEVRERAKKSLENYYVKDLCQNFKERFKGFDIQDIDSYENYNLQNILDDLRHIQVLLQGSPSKTTFKQKRDFLIRLSQEMLTQIRKEVGFPSTMATPTKPGKSSLATAKKETPAKKENEVKLPPLNTKVEPESEHVKKPSPPAVKPVKKPEDQKPGDTPSKTPAKEDGSSMQDRIKKQLQKKLSLPQEKPQKIVSLPEISEERASDVTVDTVRPTSLNDIDSMVLTKEQEEMLQKTLKKHGLKAEVWTSYLETKLNHYSNFTHHWHKKHDNKLDIHLELAKFEKEYERYVVRQSSTQKLLNYRPSKESSLLKTVLNSTHHTSANRARSQVDGSRAGEHDEYQMSQIRTETDIDEKLNRTSSDSLHFTPKRRLLPFKLNVAETPQKSEMVLPSDENVEIIPGKPRRDQMSLDFSTASSKRARMVSPVLAFNLSPIAQFGLGTPNGDSKMHSGLKKVLSLTPKDLDTIKKNHAMTSSVMAISKEVSEADINNRTLRVSHMGTIDSAIIKSPRYNKFATRSVLKEIPALQNSNILSRRPNEVTPWEDSSIRQSNTMKTVYSSKTGTTIMSQEASSKLLLSTKSPGFSGIKVSEVIDLEYANTVRRIHLLGAGSEAKVFLCQIKEFEEIVALKQYDLVKDKKSSFQSYESLKKEFHMLRELNHENIVRYLSLYKPRRTAYSNCIEFGIIMEYMSGGSLESYIEEKNQDISFKAKKSIMKQILKGLDFLHQNNIIHRDLKPGNILMSEDKTNIKITDFGISIKTDNDSTAKRTWVGTPWYMAPEVINQETYSSKADIWSAGCCFYHLITGKKPFHNANAIQALMLMVNNKSPLDLSDSSLLQEIEKHEGVKELLESCFLRGKSERPSAAKLLEHALFADVE